MPLGREEQDQEDIEKAAYPVDEHAAEDGFDSQW
jgi:hypothetical protein